MSGVARSNRSSAAEALGLYGVSIAVTLSVSAGLVAATGGSWTEAIEALFDGSLGNAGRIGTTVGVMVPILVVAVGSVVGARAGLINIGQEGQLLIGAAFATYFAVKLPGPGPLVLAAALLMAVVGGALWAGIAAGLRYRRGVPEVLTTLLLVTVAGQLVGYGLKREDLLLGPVAGRANRNLVSEQLGVDTRIPRVGWFGNEFPVSLLAALVLVVVVALVLSRTIVGFRLRMLGHNQRTAHRAGVSGARYGSGALLVSGGLAGLAGGLMLAGGDFANYQFVPGFAVNIGWTGLLVALVARQRVAMVVPLAFVFAALRTGSGFLAATGVERRVTDVVQALLVLALLVPPAILVIRERRRALAATEART